MIYFIKAADMVKIGHARDPKSRAMGIATGCPFPIEIIGTMNGGAKEEGALHRRFASDHVHNEWFRLTDEIQTFVQQNKVHLQKKKLGKVSLGRESISVPRQLRR